MFDHLIKENNLLPAFASYGLEEKDILFIKEQIAGPCKDSKDQVNMLVAIFI
jgi:deoxynucleoside triphosphate triphosphohydrolase SAMHD1